MGLQAVAVPPRSSLLADPTWSAKPPPLSLSMMLDATAIARLCVWLERAELPAPPLDTLPGVQAFDVELLRRQVLHSVQVGDGD